MAINRSRCYVRQGRCLRQQRLARQQQDASHLAPNLQVVRVQHEGGKIIKVKVCTRCLAAGKVQRAPRGQVAVA
jgi:large subunit ribosomal protein L28